MYSIGWERKILNRKIIYMVIVCLAHYPSEGRPEPMGSKVNVCIYDQLNSEKCVKTSVNCDFSSAQDRRLLDSYDKGFKKSVGRESKRIFNREVSLEPARGDYYGRINKDVDVIRSEGFATCSGVGLLNVECKEAVLAHVVGFQVSEPMLKILEKSLETNPDCVTHRSGTAAFLLLSSIEHYEQGIDSFEYRKIICSASEAVRGSRLLIFHSSKSKTESDAVRVSKSDEGFTISIARQNEQSRKTSYSRDVKVGKNGTIQWSKPASLQEGQKASPEH